MFDTRERFWRHSTRIFGKLATIYYHGSWNMQLNRTKRSGNKKVCVQLPASADNLALPAFGRRNTAERRPCSKRSICPARRAHSSKPAAAAYSDRM